MSNSSASEERQSTLVRTTPDFPAMVGILFWNSQGFFFFGFILPIVGVLFLNASGTEIGIIYSFRVLGGLISLPITGWLVDKYPHLKRPCVLLGSVGRGTAYIVLYLAIQARSFNAINFAMFLQGFGVGIFWPPFDAMIAEKSSKYHRSYAFGQRGGQIGLGNLVGTLISFVVFAGINSVAPDNAWFLFCPLLLFAFTNYWGGWLFYSKVNINLSYSQYLKDLQIESDNSQQNLEKPGMGEMNHVSNNKLPFLKEMEAILPPEKISPRASRIALMGAVFLFIGLVFTAMNEIIAKPFIQLYLYDTITRDTTLIMLIYFPAEIIAMLLGPKLGEMADHLNYYVGISCTCVLGVLVTWAVITVRSGLAICLLLIADATLARITGLIVQNLLSRVSPAHRGLILGLKTWVGHLGEVVGPILGGVLWDMYGMRAPFIASMYIEIMLVPIFLAAIAAISPVLMEKLVLNQK